MTAHCLQHVPFEGIGSIQDWLARTGAATTSSRLYLGEPLPDPDRLASIDLLVVMGGPMSVHEEREFAWLGPEKATIRSAIQRGVAVLGICLGAQLVAASLGARVYPGPGKEIGWFPIRGRGRAPGAFRFPDVASVFHWHGDTFDLPPGATLLASSDACGNQAFQIGPRVMGLQFHLEVTEAQVRRMVEGCRAELQPAPWVQSEAHLLAVPSQEYARINAMMDEVLDYLAGPAYGRARPGSAAGSP